MDSLFWRGDLDQSEHLDGTIPAFPLAEFLMEYKHLRDLVSDGKDRIEGGHGFLEDHGDPVAPYVPHVAHGQVEEVSPVEVDSSVGNSSRRLRYKPHDGKGCHALATTRLPDQPKGLSLVQIKAHIIDGLGYALESVEVCLELLNVKEVRILIDHVSRNASTSGFFWQVKSEARPA